MRQEVAELYNDDEFVPTTESLPELHSMFAEPMTLKLSTMRGGKVTADIVKAKLADARAKLLQVC
jgi:hypothetical protein